MKKGDVSASKIPFRAIGITAGVLLVAAIAIFATVGSRPSVPQDDQGQLHEKGPVNPELHASSRKNLEPRLQVGRRISWQETDDPAKDGWDTEKFHLGAQEQLTAIGNLLARPTTIEAADVAALITQDFACDPLLPSSLATVFEDPFLKIERAGGGDERRFSSPRDLEADVPGAPVHHGPEGFVQALRAAAAGLSAATNVRFEFKVFDVRASANEILTRQYLSIFGQTENGSLEQHAAWVAHWTPLGDGELPRVRSIQVEEYEQTTTRRPGVLFSDCTESVLGGNVSYAAQFLRGMNHWLERIQDTRYFALLGNPGLTVGDVNGDGLDDLYVCQEAGLPNRLFVQNPDGSARDESSAWGVDWLESSRSALLVDLDNDADQDLVVAILGGVAIAENDGEGRFRLRDVLASGEDTMSLSAVDYDDDGRLDLYVCVYNRNRGLETTNSAPLPGAAAGFVVHDANDGASNSLWRNEISSDSAWHFRDVTQETGLDANNHRYSFAAAWDDFDNDGDLDLYVANDYGRDNLYRNDRPHPPPSPKGQGGGRMFVDVAGTAHIEDSGTGMSVTWGDVDRDGWMDVLVSNMWSSAGQRITRQDQFKPDVPTEIKRRYQRLGRGNTLLRNRGDGTFVDHSASAGIEVGRWAWGSHFVDVNNDGWDDMIVSNGYLTTNDTGDL